MDKNEKSLTDMRAEHAKIVADARAIVDKAKSEKRNLTAEEKAQYDTLSVDLRSLSLDIQQRELENRSAKIDEKPVKRVSLRNAILGLASHENNADFEAINERGREQFKGTNFGDKSALLVGVSNLQKRSDYIATDTDTTLGGNTIESDRMGILLPLMNDLILTQLGARVMTGLQGNVEFPSYTAGTAAWEGEVADAPDFGGSFPTPLKFSPKRLTAQAVISKQLLMQSSEDVEGLIRQYIVEAVQQKLESTIFGKTAKSDTVPAGLFATNTSALTFSWDNMVEMEAALGDKNALKGNVQFVMHPRLLALGKTTLRKAGVSGYIIENNTCNGYNIVKSNNVCKGVIADGDFGAILANWQDYFVGQWGGLELTVDAFTKAKNAEVVITINSYFDAGELRADSFAKYGVTKA
jgi:HK97 family phage major capsid protein